METRSKSYGVSVTIHFFDEIPLDVVTCTEINLGTGVQNANGKSIPCGVQLKREPLMRIFYLRIPQK